MQRSLAPSAAPAWSSRGLASSSSASASAAADALVLYEQRGRVGIVTLSAPRSFNALTAAMGARFVDVLRAVDTSQTHALVLTGAGKAFSAGGDLDFLRARAADTPGRNEVIMRSF